MANQSAIASTGKKGTKPIAIETELITKAEFDQFQQTVADALRVVVEGLNAISEQAMYTAKSVDNLTDTIATITELQDKQHKELMRILKELDARNK